MNATSERTPASASQQRQQIAFLFALKQQKSLCTEIINDVVMCLSLALSECIMKRETHSTLAMYR